MHKLFNPKSIAVIGASNNKKKLGYTIFSNLKNTIDFLYPINLQEKYIQDIKAYKSVLDIKKDIDVAIIVVPKIYVFDTLKECVQKNKLCCDNCFWF